MAIDNTKITRRLFDEVWSQGKLEVIGELVDPKFVSHDPMLGKLDFKAYKNSVTSYRSAFPDLKFQIDALLTDGNKVITRWTATGTHRGQFGKIPPTGKQATVTGITIGEYQSGKLMLSFSEMNTLGLMQQLGVEGGAVAAPSFKPAPEAGARH